MTASGEPYDSKAMTAAHRTLAFGTQVKVTYLKTGKTVEVTINDRGPHVKGRIIDSVTGKIKKIFGFPIPYAGKKKKKSELITQEVVHVFQ